MEFTFSAPLWLWQAPEATAWHFITLPLDVAGQIKFFVSKRRGFGSVRVKATIGKTTWKTSVFPDKKTGSFFLPVKAEVRKKENLVLGKDATITLWIEV